MIFNVIKAREYVEHILRKQFFLYKKNEGNTEGFTPFEQGRIITISDMLKNRNRYVG